MKQLSPALQRGPHCLVSETISRAGKIIFPDFAPAPAVRPTISAIDYCTLGSRFLFPVISDRPIAAGKGGQFGCVDLQNGRCIAGQMFELPV